MRNHRIAALVVGYLALLGWPLAPPQIAAVANAAQQDLPQLQRIPATAD